MIINEYEVAHINEQGVDVVVVFVDPQSVAEKSALQLSQFATQLQTCATSAGLRGNVAMVWPGGFWAPQKQHAFFQSPGGSFQALAFRVNRKLRCKF